MNGWYFLLLAVVANIATNFSLKTAVRAADTTSIKTVISSLITSPFAWMGLFFAGVLLTSFMVAIRLLPLSTAYAVLTALAIASMTLIEGLYQGESIGMVKVAGLVLVVIGVTLVTSNT